MFEIIETLSIHVDHIGVQIFLVTVLFSYLYLADISFEKVIDKYRFASTNSIAFRGPSIALNSSVNRLSEHDLDNSTF